MEGCESMDTADMIQKLQSCPHGSTGKLEFENLVLEILTYLFYPPLQKPKTVPRPNSRIESSGVIFPNREDSGDSNWAQMRRELNARLVLFEFMNFKGDEIGMLEVIQTRSFLSKPMGNLAIICSDEQPGAQAHNTRNSIYSDDEVVILFIDKSQIIEMMNIKARGEDPAKLIMDELEYFYIYHK